MEFITHFKEEFITHFKEKVCDARPKGPFNNYVNKMKGGGGVKKCLFLSMIRV